MAKKKEEVRDDLVEIGSIVVVDISISTMVGSYSPGVPITVTVLNQEELSRFIQSGIAHKV